MKYIKILIAFLLFFSIANINNAQTPPPSCSISGLVINPSSDQPYPNGNIYFSNITLPVQIISGTTIQPLQFTVKTNSQGLINPPITLPQGLKICITMGGPAFPGTLVQIPATSSGDFATILLIDRLIVSPNPCIINPVFTGPTVIF